MILTITPENLIDFDHFIQWYPENSAYRYELHQGAIIQMPKPRGKHSQIAGYLMTELSFEIRRLGLPYFVPKECIVKADNVSGYEPDVIVLDQELIENEPRGERESTIIYGQTIKLIIEVVSNNWSDDYALKLDVYETMGIQEYWIVDYLGLGGRRFIGYPKQPTLTVYQLEAGEYQANQFRERQLIKSGIFPELPLTATKVFTCSP
jgi:Uma2 family endonuclease